MQAGVAGAKAKAGTERLSQRETASAQSAPRQSGLGRDRAQTHQSVEDLRTAEGLKMTEI